MSRHWTRWSEDIHPEEELYVCPCCDAHMHVDSAGKYCPACGADLDGYHEGEEG